MLDKDLILNKIKLHFKNDDILFKIISVNVIFYLIEILISIVSYFFNAQNALSTFIEKWLYLTSDFKAFIFKIHTLLTYQFLHASFFHLFFNMIMIFYFGRIFTTLTHKKRLFPLYLLGGIFSGLFYFISFNIFPQLIDKGTVFLVGSSGSAMAILGAVITLIPERELYLFGRFKIKMKWLAYFSIIINVLGIVSNGEGGNFAHLGGLLFGYIFIQASQKGIDLANPVNQVLNYVLSFYKQKKGPKISFINDQFISKKQYSKKVDKNVENKMKAILEKLKEGGYENLSKAEKDFLFKNSN